MAASRITKPGSWECFKLLLWKNCRMRLRRKLQTTTELLTPVMVGLFFMLLRGLLPAPGHSPARSYEPFSPFHLPLGQIPDLDVMLNSSRFINRKAPVAEGMCELIRLGQLEPNRFSIRSLLNLAQKVDVLDPDNLDFKRPEFKNLLNTLDLPAVLQQISLKAANEGIRNVASLMGQIEGGNSQLNRVMLTDTVSDFLQSHRREILKTIKEVRNKTSTVNPQLKRWLIIWSPANNLLSSIMAEAASRIPFVGCAVDNSSLLLDALTRPLPFNRESYMLGGVSFPDYLHNATSLPPHLPVTLRFPGLTRLMYDPVLQQDIDVTMSYTRSNWDTSYVFPKNPTPGARNSDEAEGGSPGYWKEGFLGLQSSISAAVVAHYNRTLGGRMPPLHMQLQRFPEPAAYEDPHEPVILHLLILGFNIAFFFLVMRTVRDITAEKESQFKEALRIAGVSSWLHYAAWFVPAFTSFLFGAGCLTLILKIPVENLRILPFSDARYIFVLFFVYSLCSVTGSFFISVCFNTASNGTAGAGAIGISLNVVYGMCELRSLRVPYNHRVLLSWLPNCAISYAFKTIMSLESKGSGLNWDTFSYTIPDSEDVSVATLMEMMLIEAVILSIATLYMEAIRPGPFAIPLPWYFPFTRQFWFGTKPMPYVEVANNKEKVLLEPEPRHLPAGVQIRNLRKVYGNGKVAVHNLTLNLYEGQITVLLGHNGAGKTTAMSMLTGITAPTSGVVIVAGFSLTSNLKKARESLGICLQGNILLDDLTVAEHLYLMCKLKGLTELAVVAETNKYLKILQLEPKANVLTKNISGGMKRKLAAALALCGGSSVVLFDEPTSGMDPAARRALWDLLQAEKAGRTVLLTTHFMDEADLLGDRIAIMSEGRLRAAGSSFFLKKQHGGGYRLVLVKNPGCKADDVTDFLRNYLPDIEAVSDLGSELCYGLPDHCAPQFENMFKALEDSCKKLNINSYGITTATIEDVFMNVVANTQRHSSHRSESTGDYPLENESSDTYVTLGVEPLLSGLQLLLRQILALLSKHFLQFTRSPLGYFIAIFGPACIATAVIHVAGAWQGTKNLPPRHFTFQDYPGGYASTFGPYGHDHPVAKALESLITADGGTMEIMDNPLDPEASILKHFVEKPLSALTNFVISLVVSDDKMTAMFNNQAFHSAPLALQMAYNSFLRVHVNQSVLLTFNNHPLPYSGMMKTIIQQKGFNVSFNLAYYAAIGFGLLLSWLLMAHVRDRASGTKLLQFMAGVNPIVYWAVAFIWDMMMASLSTFIYVLVIYWFKEEGYATFEDACKSTVVILAFFLASLPLTYIWSLFLKAPATAFMTVSLWTDIFGPLAFVFLATVRLYKLLTKPSLDWWVEVMTWVPSFALSDSMQNLNRLYWLQEFCQPINEKYCSLDNVKHACCRDKSHCPPEGCLNWTENFLDVERPGVGKAFQYFLITGVVASTLLLLIELHCFHTFLSKRKRTSKDAAAKLNFSDADVGREWNLVHNVSVNESRDLNLLVKEISKDYGNFKAVKNLSLLVPAGECFGLLGVNGAGKTTCFRILTGDLDPTSGDAFVHGYSVLHHRKQVHKLVGYCPQFDALFDKLTGRETLRFFCLLRGVPDQEVELTCEKLARELLFYPYIDMKVREYSGGNKRKLSTALALVGDPPVVYLDEPTTGMDPVAKRYFWDVLCKLRSTGKTIILTSHSMEECEALCTRVGIMVRGELLCIGSPQHLKTKFTQGYCLTVMKKQTGNAVKKRFAENPVCQFIEENLPGAVLKEEHENVLTFHIPASSPMSWATMFGKLETARNEQRLEDYYLGQTSLEQVFLSFASTSSKME